MCVGSNFCLNIQRPTDIFKNACKIWKGKTVKKFFRFRNVNSLYFYSIFKRPESRVNLDQNIQNIA